MQTQKQNPIQGFNPGTEAQKLKQQMQQFQQEVGQLRKMANEARQRTLDSMKQGMLSAPPGNLQKGSNPNIQPQNKMANPSRKTSTKEASTESHALNDGMQALQYTDLQMAKLIDKMQNQVEKSMQAAMNATTGGSQVIADAMKQTQDGLKSQSTQAEQTAAADQQAMHEQAMAEMERAQQAVANTLNISGAPQAPPGKKPAGKK